MKTQTEFEQEIEEMFNPKIERDGPAEDEAEQMLNTQELWQDENPLIRHSEALAKACDVVRFEITKFDPRGM